MFNNCGIRRLDFKSLHSVEHNKCLEFNLKTKLSSSCTQACVYAGMCVCTQAYCMQACVYAGMLYASMCVCRCVYTGMCTQVCVHAGVCM